MAERISIETIRNVLDAQAWESAVSLARTALSQGKWKRSEEAFLLFAITRSLSNMDQYDAALEPGQRAVIVAEQAKSWDILGRALIELAWAQHKNDGLQKQAVITQKRYFEFFGRYGEEGRSRYMVAMFNLGVILRVAGDHEAALTQFLKTKEEAAKRREADWADKARRNAVGEALVLRSIAKAEELINAGEDYIKQHGDNSEAVASHLIDRANLLYLKGDFPLAKCKAQEAARLVGNGALFSQAYEVLHRIAKEENKPDAAIATGIVAAMGARQDERVDLLEQIDHSIQDLLLRHPKAADRFCRKMTSAG